MQRDEICTEVGTSAGITYGYLFHKSGVIGKINPDNFVLLSHTQAYTDPCDYVLWLLCSVNTHRQRQVIFLQKQINLINCLKGQRTSMHVQCVYIRAYEFCIACVYVSV